VRMPERKVVESKQSMARILVVLAGGLECMLLGCVTQVLKSGVSSGSWELVWRTFTTQELPKTQGKANCLYPTTTMTIIYGQAHATRSPVYPDSWSQPCQSLDFVLSWQDISVAGTGSTLNGEARVSGPAYKCGIEE
jgi:hypothetical protein